MIEYNDLVTTSYQKILNRSPDESGLKTYTSFLKKGNSQESLEKILMSSDEYKNQPLTYSKKSYNIEYFIDCSVAIVIHIGYEELLDNFKNNIENVKEVCKNVKIYIHSILDNKLNEQIYEEYGKDVIIINSPNIGMDISSKLKLIPYIKEDYALFLHTKKNEQWRNNLINDLCNTKQDVYNCLKTFINNHKIGLIGSKHCIRNHKTANLEKIKEILVKNNIYDEKLFYKIDKNNDKYDYDEEFYNNFFNDVKDVKDHYKNHGKYEHERIINEKQIINYPEVFCKFIAGTMFWMRLEYIKQLQNLNLSFHYNQLERGYIINREETYTHSWEYLFGIICYIYGFQVSIPKQLQNITLVLPGLPIKPLCGGTRTALNLTSVFEKDYNINIYVINKHEYNSSYVENFNCLSSFTINNEIYNKFIIATGWQTVDYVKNYINTNKRIYLIQDYEAEFYEKNSIDYEKALNTYKSKDNFDLKISINKYMSYYLYKLFDYKIWPISFGIDKNKFFNENEKRNNTVVLVYIPSKKRRLPHLIEKCYEILKKNKIDTMIIGEDVENSKIPTLGSKTSAELKDIYNQSKIGIIFSASNPSRMGFEMGACGLPVIELENESNYYDLPNNIFYKIKTEIECLNTVQKILKMDKTEYENKSKIIENFCSTPIENEKKCFFNLINNNINEV